MIQLKIYVFYWPPTEPGFWRWSTRALLCCFQYSSQQLLLTLDKIMTRRELRSLNSKYLRQIVDTIYSKHIKKTDLYLSGTYREQACFLKLNRKQSMREIQLSSNWRKPGSKFTMVEKHRHDECKTFDKHLTFLTFDIPAHVSLIWSAYDQPVNDIRKVTTPTTPQLCSNTYASRSERKILHGIERKKLGKFRDKTNQLGTVQALWIYQKITLKQNHK